MGGGGRREARSALRRREIIEAALGCFTEQGFSQATMEAIQRRSGASNGTIYHFFKSKEQLAAAVYLAGIADYQRFLVTNLERCREPRDGVFEVVRSHLRWVHEHFEWARFLFQTRRSELIGPARDELKRANQAFLRALRSWLEPHQSSGRMRSLPTDVLVSLLLGPCQAYVRTWLDGEARTPPERAAGPLAVATWGALRTTTDP